MVVFRETTLQWSVTMDAATPAPTLTELEEFLLNLYDDKSIGINLKEGFETVASRDGQAPPTPMFFNFRPQGLRNGCLVDADYEDIADFLHEKIDTEDIQFDVIAAVPRAGEKLAQFLSERMGYRGDYLTFDKESGELQPNNYKKGLRVLLVDDVVSNGQSKVRFIQALQAAGHTVVVLVLVDRGQGGKECLDALGVPLYALTTAREFLKLLVDEGEITESVADEVARRMWG